MYNIRVSFVPERTGPLSGNSLVDSFDLAHGEAVICSLATQSGLVDCTNGGL